MCPGPRRENVDFCHICAARGHDTLLCKVRGVQCGKCGFFGHEGLECSTRIRQDTNDFWDTSTESDPATYKRIVNVEESLFQEKADTDRIIMLESEKLIEFTASRKPLANADISVLEFLRKT